MTPVGVSCQKRQSERQPLLSSGFKTSVRYIMEGDTKRTAGLRFRILDAVVKNKDSIKWLKFSARSRRRKTTYMDISCHDGVHKNLPKVCLCLPSHNCTAAGSLLTAACSSLQLCQARHRNLDVADKRIDDLHLRHRTYQLTLAIRDISPSQQELHSLGLTNLYLSGFDAS